MLICLCCIVVHQLMDMLQQPLVLWFGNFSVSDRVVTCALGLLLQKQTYTSFGGA